MGLDITAHNHLKQIGTAPNYDAYEDQGIWETTLYAHHGWFDEWRSFPDHCRDLTPGGIYAYDDTYQHRVGSYSSYSWWRNELSKLVYGVEAPTVWSNEADYEGKPFYRLIHFTDCDGIIGTEVAKALSADFESHSLTPPADWTEDDRRYFADVYDIFKTAFKLAADGGCVIFH